MLWAFLLADMIFKSAVAATTATTANIAIETIISTRVKPRKDDVCLVVREWLDMVFVDDLR